MENYRPKRPSRPVGGQHAAAIGDSTMHHRCPWDFSTELERAEFEAERQRLAAERETIWF